jgi:hypothetical protein
MPTETHLKLRRIQGFFLIYLVLAGLVTADMAILMARNPVVRSWVLGDWLINLQGGLVRRGLTGELVRLLANRTPLSSVSIVIVLQLALYSVLFLSMWKLLRRSEWPFWVAALAFSPATLGFQILDPFGGFRKEILFLAGLGVLLCVLSNDSFGETGVSLYLTLLLAISALSHELVLCYLPYFAAATAIMIEDPRRILRVLAAPALIAFAAASFVALHPGSARTADSICTSLASQNGAGLAGICDGAIEHLRDTQAQAREGVRRIAQTPAAYRIYGLRLALALLPVAAGFGQLWQCPRNRRPLLILGAAATVSAIATIPLFLHAIDWGRWIYIHIVCLALLLFLIDLDRQRLQVIPAIQSGTRRRPLLQLVLAFALLIYAVTWNLPHIVTDSNRNGYLGLLRFAARRSK